MKYLISVILSLFIASHSLATTSSIAGYSSGDGYDCSVMKANPTQLIFVGKNLVFVDSTSLKVRFCDESNILHTIPSDGKVVGADDVATYQGKIYIVDRYGNKVVETDLNGSYWKLVAGIGTVGLSGDGSLAIFSQLNNPGGIAISKDGIIYISDTGNQSVRYIENGIIYRLTGTPGQVNLGDGGLAINAGVRNPKGLTVDNSGNIYIADSSNHRIRKVTKSSGIIITLAGTSKAGINFESGDAMLAQLNNPNDIAVLDSGEVLVADTGNNRIRKINANGTIELVAGGDKGFQDGNIARFSSPYGITIKDGDIYIGDTLNGRIRLIKQSVFNTPTIAIQPSPSPTKTLTPAPTNTPKMCTPSPGPSNTPGNPVFCGGN